MTTRGRLACAALVSLAVHGLVISGVWMLPPQPPDSPERLDVRLVPLETQAAPADPVARPARRAAPAPAPARSPDAPVAAAPGPLAFPPAETGPEEAPAEPVAAEPPQHVALAPESTAAIARALPLRGRITYALVYGEARTGVGKVVQSWEMAGGAYRISSEAETTGLIEFFRPQRLRYVSQGRITRDGLQPESFDMSRTRRGRNESARAQFDWGGASLTYGIGREPKNAPLASGAQDLMSLIYQFAVVPPAPGRSRVPVTTGTRFDVYEIEVLAEERIETPIGTLRALPVKQLPRPGVESIQVWLAADYHYLPVRIRHYDRDGAYSGEQVVSEIRISEE